MRLIAKAMPTYDRDQPPVGRPCDSAEQSNIQTKPSMKGKVKTIPSPRRCTASRWSALRQWPTNQYSKKGDPHIRYLFSRLIIG